MVLHKALAVSLLASSADAFSSLSGSISHVGSKSTSFLQQPTPSSSVAKTARAYGTALRSKLYVGAELNPDEVLPLDRETMITPEGFGFSSPVSRVLNMAGRQGGYYKARASEIVTDVMEGITNGQVDAALVFADENDDLVGIFTETDYIKVRSDFVDWFFGS